MNPANFLRDTIDLVKQIENRFLELAGRLYAIKEKEMWKSTYDSYQEFLEAAKINPGHASILTQIHKAYVVDGRIQFKQLGGIGYSNLYEAIPLIEKHGIDKTIVMAATLTRTEIKEEVRDEKFPDCPHSETFTICAKCHKRV